MYQQKSGGGWEDHGRRGLLFQWFFLSIFIIWLWAVAGKVEPSQQQSSWQTEQSTKNIDDFEMC